MNRATIATTAITKPIDTATRMLITVLSAHTRTGIRSNTATTTIHVGHLL